MNEAVNEELAVERWLTDEAREHLLEVGRFGLYEFLWTLNGSRFTLTAARARLLSGRIATTLASTVASLYRVRWPSHEVVAGPLPLSVLDRDESWQVGDEFVALVPRPGV